MSFLLHDPIWKPLDSNGALMPGAYLKFFETETTTPVAVYADAELTTPLDQTAGTGDLTANAGGAFPAVYGSSEVVYRRQLYDADDQLIEDTDPIHPTAQWPAGSVVFFNGDETARDAAYPPSLWEVCDGDGGTIDFRDRFPVGASATKTVGTTGGTASGGTLNTGSAGAHDHDGSTASANADLAPHRHLMFIEATGTGAVTASNQVYEQSTSGGDEEYSMDGGSDAATVGRTSETGSGGGHAHGITEASSHQHTYTNPAPPWGALWILQRKA